MSVPYDPDAEPRESLTESRCLELVRAGLGDDSVEVRYLGHRFWDPTALVADRYRAGRVFSGRRRRPPDHSRRRARHELWHRRRAQPGLETGRCGRRVGGPQRCWKPTSRNGAPMRSPVLRQAWARRGRRTPSTAWCWDTPSNPLRSSTTARRSQRVGTRSVSTCRWPGQDIVHPTSGSTREPQPWTSSVVPSWPSPTPLANQDSITPPTSPEPQAFPSKPTPSRPQAGTTFTGSDQAASFWFVPTAMWHGGPAAHLRHHTCSRRLCEPAPVTPPAATPSADLLSLRSWTDWMNR